ncbi:MAG: Rnf-Nqr domain containing protein [Oscillospiraceae bacterium]
MDLLISILSRFVILSIAAILAENAIFIRGLGTDRLILITEDIHSIFNFGKILTFITTVTSGFVYFVDSILYRFKYNDSLKPLAYVLVMGFVYLILHLILKKFSVYYKKIDHYISIAVFNCTVLGTMLLSSFSNLDFISSISFGFGSGVGYTLSLVLVCEGNRKTKHRNIPPTFKGLPSMLIYIGILSMALYGLLGYQI